MNDSQEDVWKAIAKIRIAMLTTHDEAGLVSRPMASLARPEDGLIYFITRIDAKIGDIGGSAPVNLAYSDPHDNLYVSVSGTASTSQDREKLRELWSMFSEAWLPQGPDGADVALITVEPDEAKMWDSTSSNLLYAGKVLKAVVTQSPPSGGRVEEVHLGNGEAKAAGNPDRKLFEDFGRKMSETEALDASSAGGPTA